MTKKCMELIKKRKKSQRCSGRPALDELSDKEIQRSVCLQHNGLPMEPEFCFTLYIATASFISSKTLIKLSRSITTLCAIVMCRIHLGVWMSVATESTSKVSVFVSDFPPVAWTQHLLRLRPLPIRSCSEFHGSSSYLDRTKVEVVYRLVGQNELPRSWRTSC